VVSLRTDSTLTRRKRTNNNVQNTTHKTKDRATRTPLKTNNDLQNSIHKTKDLATRTPLNTRGEFKSPGRDSS